MRTLRSYLLGILGVAGLALSNNAMAGWETTFITPSACSISQSTSTHQCSVTFSWFQSYEDDGTNDSASQKDLYVNSQFIGSAIDGSFNVNLNAGNNTYELRNVKSGSIQVNYQNYTPYSFSTSTHNIIYGDYNGDGIEDRYLQPKAETGNNSLMPKELNQYLDPNYHVEWTSTHPDITQIENWSEEFYGAYSANLSNSPGDEILLLGKKEIILIHGDIVTPISLFNNIRNAIVSWDANGNATYTVFNFDADPDQYVVLFADFNGDGYDEIVLQGKSKGSSLHILNRDGSIRQTIGSGFQGLDWSNATYDLVISDINNDGRADIQMLSKVSGTPDNFAYSNAAGKIDSVAEAYHIEEEPKAATLVGTTGGDFSVDESGSATFTMLVTAPAGTAGVSPKISLSYSSKGSNGPVGYGWSLNGLSSISRCAKNIAQNGEIVGIQNNTTDKFCLNGQQLFVETGVNGANGTTYRFESLSNDTITSFDTDGDLSNGPEYFTVKTRGGDTNYYGKHNADSTNALVKATNDDVNRFWLLERTVDFAGNYIQYKYGKNASGSEHFIDEILYTGNEEYGLAPYNKIDLVYADDLNSAFERTDQTHGYSVGSQVAMTKLLKQVKVYNEGLHQRTFQIYHQVSNVGDFNGVKAIQECSYLGNCFEPVRFEYSTAAPSYNQFGIYFPTSPSAGFLKALDVDGSGRTDLLAYKNTTLYLTKDFGSQTSVSPAIGESEFLSIKPIDLNADGTMDFIAKNGDGWHRWTYMKASNSFEKKRIGIPTSISSENLFVVDLDGDGKQDLLDLTNGQRKWYRQKRTVTTQEICERVNQCFNSTAISYFDSQGVLVSFYNSGSNFTYPSLNKKAQENGTRFSDFNGDGVTDLIAIAQSLTREDRHIEITSSGLFGFVFNPELKKFVAFDQIGPTDAKNVTPTDINGDGLTDILYVDNDKWYMSINKGGSEGFADAVNTGIPADDEDENNRSIILDYDRDGQVEFWVYRKTGSLSYYHAYNFDGEKFNYVNRLENVPDDPVTVYADTKGNGNADLIMAEPGTSVWQRWAVTNAIGAPRPNLLTKITNAYGVTTDITYKSMTNPSVYTNTSNRPEAGGSEAQLTMPMMLVAKVESDTATFDSASKEERLAISYQYEDFRVDLEGRGMLGFKKLITHDEQSSITTETEYNQTYPLTGLPKTTTRKVVGESSEVVIGQATNTWGDEMKGDERFVYLQQSVEKTWMLDSDGTPANLIDNPRRFINQVITKNTDHDSHGNVLSSEVLNTNSQAVGGVNGSQWFKTVTSNGYGANVNNPTEYEKKYARLSRVTVTKTRSGITDPEVETSAFEYYPEGYNGSDGFPGLLKAEKSFVNADGSLKNKSIVKSYIYDKFANRTKETISAKERDPFTGTFDTTMSSRTTETVYNSINGRYVESIKNDLDHIETFTYEPRFGGIKTTTGPNGLVSSYDYDESGVKFKTVGVDGTYGTERLLLCGLGGAACPTEALYYSEKQSFDAADYAMSGYVREFYNKIGQKIVTTTQVMGNNGSGTREIVSRVEYDKFGRVKYGYSPIFGNVNTVSPRYTQAKYDALGRLFEEIAPGNRVTTKSYLGLSTETVNAIGQTQTDTKNINGDLLSVTDNAGNVVSYIYNGKGEFITLADSVGNKVENTIDYAGHKTQTIDPDKGTWTYMYNAFGKMIRQTDARGVVITLEYDVLGRLVRRVDNATVSNRNENDEVIVDSSEPGIDTQTTCWSYDSAEMGAPGTAVKGALHKVALFAGTVNCISPGTAIPLQEKITGYDNLARAESAMQKIKSEGSNTVESYLVMSVFEQDSSRVEFTILPEEITLKNHYDSIGTLTKITDGLDESKVYKQVKNIDAFGNVVEEIIGYGSAALSSTKAYDPDTGYMTSIVAGNLANPLIQFSQGFDQIGNVVSRTDHVVNRTETFGYAEGTAQTNLLNRITSFSLNGSTVKTYSYDALGNLKSKSDIGDDYRYGAGTAGAHAVTSIWNSNSQKRSFTYDANGNMITDTDLLNSANNRQIKYSAFDKAVYIKKGSTNASEIAFRYGSERERYRRIDNVFEGGQAVEIETTYLGAYEKVTYVGGAKNGKTEHKYTIAGVALKIETETSGQSGKTTSTKYLHKDHLGSVVAISDHNGNTVERFRYDPFGKQYSIGVASPFAATAVITKLDITDRGYTGHEMLSSVDVIHMNGRIYDANLGRFMQADAYIQAPKNMQNMNRYSYVLNNPMSYTDPSGYFFKSLARMISKFKVLDFALRTIACLNGPLTCGAYTAAMAYGNGASLHDSIKSGAIAALQAFTFDKIGEAYRKMSVQNQADKLEGLIDFGKNKLTPGQIAGQIASHALAGGVFAELNGGKFGHGFISAGFTKGLGTPILDATSDNVVFGTLVSAVIGGTASELSGGKFSNGATTAIYQALFNYFGGKAGENNSESGSYANPIGYKTSGLVKRKMQDGKYYWVDPEMFGKNVATDYMAKQTGESFSDYSETTNEEYAKAAGAVGTVLTFGSGGVMYLGWGLLTSAAVLDPSPQNTISAVTGPIGKALGPIDDVLYPGTPALQQIVNNVDKVNTATTFACEIPKVCE